MQTHSKAREEAKMKRIDLRVTSQIKTTLANAAELTGLSLSAFLIETAYERARNLIKEEEILKLSDAERDKLLLLLERKPKPAAKLKAAMLKYLTLNQNK